ncbi:TPA: hypothetical protein DCZ15_00375 [Candidatus Falkowbacteria bacterium]|nr:hypothetical protein [Candidatus Falkowbacteria bacterium]
MVDVGEKYEFAGIGRGDNEVGTDLGISDGNRINGIIIGDLNPFIRGGNQLATTVPGSVGSVAALGLGLQLFNQGQTCRWGGITCSDNYFSRFSCILR